ncbi:hypothetical protein GCM10028895_35000 [Pontibacter rugosus]
MRAQAEEALIETALTGRTTIAEKRKSLTEEINTKNLKRAVSAALLVTETITEEMTVNLSTPTSVKEASVARLIQTDARVENAVLQEIDVKEENVARLTLTEVRVAKDALMATEEKVTIEEKAVSAVRIALADSKTLVKDARLAATDVREAKSALTVATEEKVASVVLSTQKDRIEEMLIKEVLTLTEEMTAAEAIVVKEAKGVHLVAIEHKKVSAALMVVTELKEERDAHLVAEKEEKEENAAHLTATAHAGKMESAAATETIDLTAAEAGKAGIMTVASAVKASQALATNALTPESTEVMTERKALDVLMIASTKVKSLKLRITT